MAHSIEGRVPFLDLEMIKLAQKIPAEYKLYGNPPMEKWVLRKAFEDMLPEEILWRRKEQFDEGSGTADIMPRLAAEAMSDNEYQHHIAQNSRLQLRSKEEAYYHRLFDRVYENSRSVLETVGRWADRPEWI